MMSLSTAMCAERDAAAAMSSSFLADFANQLHPPVSTSTGLAPAVPPNIFWHFCLVQRC